MLNRIKNKLIPNSKRPIIDLSISDSIDCGYTEGNLSGVNCLVVGSGNVVYCLERTLKYEQANVEHLELEMITDIDSIKRSALEIVGPYDCILNVFKVENRDCINQIQACYQVLQVEVDYLVTLREGYTTSIVCTFIDKTNSSKSVVKEALKNFIVGLSEQIGRHNIVINELFADETVDSEIVAKWNCIMASKFGHVLAGEVIELGNLYVR